MSTIGYYKKRCELLEKNLLIAVQKQVNPPIILQTVEGEMLEDIRSLEAKLSKFKRVWPFKKLYWRR